MDGEAGWWTTSGNIGLPPLARVMGVGRQQQQAELQNIMSKANMSFGSLCERPWHNHNVSIRVKEEIYRAIILSTLLYGAETWMVYRRNVKKLHTFRMKHLCSTMKIKRQDSMTNIKLLNRAALSSLEDLLVRKNLGWTGHILKMQSDRLKMQDLYSQLPGGPSQYGRPRLHYKETINRI